MKKTLWLTYAWRDNEQQDIDHVIAQLKSSALDVKYDRVRLIAGLPLWDQIDNAITDSTACDAWAIFATKASLESKPCREELAYALKRALASRSDFPLIGIFPEPIDSALVPSALDTRLYVSLQDPQWVDRVRDAVLGTRTVQDTPPPAPFHITWHRKKQLVLEVRPRSGRWYPFTAMVLENEKRRMAAVMVGPFGAMPMAGMTGTSDVSGEVGGRRFAGERVSHAVTNLDAAYVYFNIEPTSVLFGQEPNLFIVSPPPQRRPL